MSIALEKLQCSNIALAAQYTLLSKICDDNDDETNDGEYSANVRHSSEGFTSWRRASWLIRGDVL